MVVRRLLNNSLRVGIRQSLAYALGEVVLIVVGILLALQIDQWSQARIDEQKEREYLHLILADLEADLASIDNDLNFNADKVAKIVTLTEMLADTDEPFYGLDDNRVAQLMPTISSFTDHRPRAVSFRNMVSAESIALLQDPALRADLTDYYGDDAANVRTQERAARLSRDFSSYMLLGAIQGGDTDLFLSGQAIDLPLSITRADMMRTDPETYARISELHIITASLIQMLETERGVAVGLVDRIVAELSGR